MVTVMECLVSRCVDDLVEVEPVWLFKQGVVRDMVGRWQIDQQ